VAWAPTFPALPSLLALLSRVSPRPPLLGDHPLIPPVGLLRRSPCSAWTTQHLITTAL
jgi:hypothetical protein